MEKEIKNEEVTEEVTEEVEEVTEEEAQKSIKSFVSAEIQSQVKGAVSAAKEEMEAEIKAWKKEQEALKEKRAGLYAEGVQEKRAKTNDYLRKLATAVLGNDYVSVKELTTGDAGEHIVDRELSAEIRHLMTEYGVARREFFTVQLSKNQYDANALATDVTVAWVSEGNVIPTTRVVLNQEELKLNKLAAIATMSRELLEDQEVDLFAFIATRVAEGFAKAEDIAFFNGDGSSGTGGFTGLLQNESVPDVDYDGTITVAKIYEMIDKLPQGAHANAKFYFNRTILSVIRLLVDGDGRYLYQNPLAVSGVPTLAGYPVVLVEAMPIATADDDAKVLFGDLRRSSILGYRGGISVDRFNAGVVRNVADDADVNLITTDREAMRWVSRVGAMTILPTAVVRLENAS